MNGSKTWMVAIAALVAGGFLSHLIFCGTGGGPGSSKAAPKFRRIRFINASGTPVPKVEVKSVNPAASTLWTSTAVPADGAANVTNFDHDDHSLNNPLSPASKLTAEVFVMINAQMKTLGAVPLDTNANNDMVTDLVIVLDDDPVNSGKFKVSLFAGHSTDDDMQQNFQVVEVVNITPQ